LKRTLSFGILYKYKTDEGLIMQGWTDSDYAGWYNDQGTKGW
jgi:hypothetical protein